VWPRLLSEPGFHRIHLKKMDKGSGREAESPKLKAEREMEMSRRLSAFSF
jgi:hypothetical protein